ncbi:endothelin-converting enzyme homolog isoform X2 [Apostichopus japonicus]|uniref:endothelin-converting enzyme homolog isoform X2 n=1 Tax=Stichopus japonicus TaxID=307972 RepID=UPI003AB62DFA
MNSEKGNSVSVKYDNLQNGDCGGKKATMYQFDMESTGTEIKMIDKNGNGKGFIKRRKTRLEKKLFFVIVLLLLVLMVVVGVLLGQINREFGVGLNLDRTHSQRDSDRGKNSGNLQSTDSELGKDSGNSQSTDCALSAKEEDGNVCLTPTCVQAAADMLSRMDRSVDPCEDFYQYACGGWIKNNIIPEDQTSHGIFHELMESISVQCKALLEEERQPEEPAAITKTKQFYQSCMNEEVIDDRGTEPLGDILRQLGGWPVVNDQVFDEETWNLEEVEAKIKRLTNGNSLFSQNIYPDPKDSHNYIITINQPGLGLGSGSKEMYLQNTTHKNVEAYLELMIDIATDLREDGDREAVRAEMQEVVDFETKIAEIVLTLEERRADIAIYNKMTIDELTEITPSFNWLHYFQEMFGPNITIDGNEQLVCHARPFMEGLHRLIQTTPKRILANYVLWPIVSYTIPMLGKKQRDYLLKLNIVKYGYIQEEARWRRCYTTTNSNLFPSMGHMFIKGHFDETSKDTAEEMIDDLKASAEKVISRTEWMDNTTKASAIDKVRAISEQIGYDALTKNITAINHRYRNIQIEADKYFENSLAIWTLYYQDMVDNFRQPVVNTNWESSAVQVNAFYHFTRNHIRFPAGILQPPFFVSKGPKAMNYGGIGVIIGHELSHAFDDKGSLFDANGDLHYWWTPDSKANFDKKAQCLVNQYNNFHVAQVDMNVNGALTLGENIADNGGLNSAYEAYQSWTHRQSKPEKLLPGLGLSNEKIFFVNFGQFWCSLSKDDQLRMSLKGELHPPGSIRVLGTLSNSEYFSDVFNCSVGSTYNPEEKCKVW